MARRKTAGRQEQALVTAGGSQRDQALVTAAEWFAGGQRVWYVPPSARVLTEEEAAAVPGALHVFERATGARPDADPVWLTLLPGFPDGSYGWARVDRLLGEDLGPRLYVEPVGQGDSDKPRGYHYSTPSSARTWSRRCGGITACAGPWSRRSTTRRWRCSNCSAAQRSPQVFGTAMVQARMYSRGYHPTKAELAEMWSAVTRRDGAAFLHNAAGFVAEHRRHARRWDLAAIARDLQGTVPFYVGGSQEDPYEHRQIAAARERVPEAEVLTFPGGHLTTSEHPDLLAAAIRDIATRHGVGTPGVG